MAWYTRLQRRSRDASSGGRVGISSRRGAHTRTARDLVSPVVSRFEWWRDFSAAIAAVGRNRFCPIFVLCFCIARSHMGEACGVFKSPFTRDRLPCDVRGERPALQLAVRRLVGY